MQGQLHDLAAGLRDTDARQATGLETVRKEAYKEFACTVSQRIDTSRGIAVEQADARHAAQLAALQDQTGTLSQSLTERTRQRLQGVEEFTRKTFPP